MAVGSELLEVRAILLVPKVCCKVLSGKSVDVSHAASVGEVVRPGWNIVTELSVELYPFSFVFYF